MEDLDKIDKGIANICKGEDKKSDAMLMMAPDCNWDQFLTPAPMAIALLGELILISADTDFSLEGKPPKDGFKLLRYPNSFRTSLVQVCNEGWTAFNEAHTSMDQIRLHSGNVDNHVKNAVKFLLRGSPVEVEKMLPMSLTKVQNIADECLQLATNIEMKFVGVMELTAELLEACTNTKGVYDEKKRETEIAIKIAKTEREQREKEIKESERRMANMEKEVKEAQADFKDAISNIPTGGELLGLAVGEAIVEGVRTITSFGNNIKSMVSRKVDKLFDDGERIERDDQYYEIESSRRRVYQQVLNVNQFVGMLFSILTSRKDINGKPIPDFKGDDSLKSIKQNIERAMQHVEKELNSGDLRAIVLGICNEAIGICSTLINIEKSMSIENSDTLISVAVDNITEINKQTQTLYAEASKSLGKNPLDNKSPHLSKMPQESSSPSAVQGAIESSRYKTEIAKETLKDAKKRQEKAADELRESNEKLTEVLKEMAKLDLQNIDFDTIRDTLVKGIKALAQVREQWGKLVRFFQMLSNLIKCCLHTSLTDFVDQAKTGRELKMNDQSFALSNVFRDVIFEQASKASQVAYVVRTISGAYVEISNKHLMDRITCLGHLIALDSKKDAGEIRRRRLELHSGCAEAQGAIRHIVLEEKEKFSQNIDERIRKISELEQQMPAVEPSRVKEIKEAITSGMAKFDENEEDDLI